MHVLAVLNRGGGTLKNRDIGDVERRLVQTFREAGHTIDVQNATGSAVKTLLRDAAADPHADLVLAGGGDGTVSLAAGLLAGKAKALAILPAGTMNLFARSLHLPLDLDEAIQTLARAPVRHVDIASANGRYFVHQFSVGMHPRLIALREKQAFRSRLGKIPASGRAAIATLVKPPVIKVRIQFDDTRLDATTTSLVVTNNLYGEGRQLPYAEVPDGGRLGIYLTRARTHGAMLRLIANMAVGRWRRNEQVDIHTARDVIVEVAASSQVMVCAIDGELHPLTPCTTIALHAATLRVIAPPPIAAN